MFCCGQPALAPGERVLARLKPVGGGKYEGRSFKRLGGPEDAPARILGIVQNGQIVPTDKKQKGHWCKTNTKPQAPPQSPSERLTPTPKPSNWADMTAHEKRNLEYKHR
jgi:ribonuclease R